MSNTTEMERWLDHVSEKVRRNVSIVTPEDLGQNYLFHISPNPHIRKFIPRIGQKQANQEDRTVPRITMAPSLLGCMIGYATTEFDFLEPHSGHSADPWLGGYKIYALPFQAALRPNSKLVYDVRSSDEHWLVSYNKDSTEYIPQSAGRLFIRKITMTGRQGKLPSGDLTMYVEVKHPLGIQFSKNIFLKPGYWCISGPVTRNVYSVNDDKEFKAEEVDRVIYTSNKFAVADMLSEIPAYLQW